MQNDKVKVTAVDESQLMLLRDISEKTFLDTFARQNKPDDIADYVSKSFSIEQIQSEWENPQSLFFFVTVDDELAGYLKLNWGEAQNEKLGDGSLEIERIYVLQRYQGQQLGKLLFTTATEYATKQRMHTVWLGVWEKNDPAIGFYEKHGFQTFGKHSFMLGSDLQTDLLMKLEI